jgi:hypothetical protein
MRRLLTALIYLAMIGTGAYLLGTLFVYGGRLFMALAGGFLLLFGTYLMWIDFLSKNQDRRKG